MDAIDWGLAQRVGEMLSGGGPRLPVSAASVQPLVEQFAGEVASYSRLALPESLPPLELVDRPHWIEANIATMRPLLEPLSTRLAEGSGPLAGAMRSASGFLLGAQIGAVTGMLSQRVLGQYDIALLDQRTPPRLLLVGPNLAQAARNMALERDQLIAWVAIHEVTHAVQFGGAPWLREHLAGLLRQLIEGLEVNVNVNRPLRLPDMADMKATVSRLLAERRGQQRGALGGDFLRLTLGSERWAIVQRMQATMALVEGHAEHVMDAVGGDVLPSMPQMRAAMTRRRRERAWPWRILERLLGMELKLRQYEIGRRFCDEVVAAAGPQGLSVVWTSHETLPTPSELERPAEWLARTHVPPVTNSA